MRIASVIRVSDSRSAEKGYSVADQERAIEEYAQREGHVVVAHIRDLGISGKQIDRAGLGHIEQLIEEGAIDAVAYVRMDRLGREPWRAMQLLWEWRSRGIEPICIERPNRGRTAMERLVEGLDAHIAEVDWERIRARLMAGHREKALSGRIPIRLDALGYRQVRKWQEHLPEYAGRAGELEIHPGEAAILTILFERYAQGWTLADLARWAESEGVTGRNGCKTWTSTHVRKYLRNPLYAGTYYYGQAEHRQIQGDKKKIRKEPRPFSEWIPIPVPPIIPEDLWATVQLRLNHNSAQHVGSGQPSVYWPFQGLIFCAGCVGNLGGPLGITYHKARIRKNGTVYSYISCNSWYRKDIEWCGLRCRAEPIAERVYQRTLRYLEAGRMEQAAVQIAARQHSQRGNAQTELARINAELSELTTAETRLEDLVLAGARPERVRERMLELQARRSQLLPHLTRLKLVLDVARDPADVAQEARARTAELLEQFKAHQDDPPQLRRLYRGLLTVRVAVGPKIKLVFADP